MCTYRLKSLISVFAAAMAASAAFAPVFAQEGGWGSDVEDFSAPQRPARMTTEAGGDTDFSAALEAAAAAEGRNNANAAPAPEFVPKNEITVTKNPGQADSAAAAKADKKKEKAPKAEGSGERLNHSMGARLGVGSEFDIGLGFALGLSDVNRLAIGFNMGWGLIKMDEDLDGFSSYEAYGLYEWRYNISEELSWFWGVGGTLGFKGTEYRHIVTKDSMIYVPGGTPDSIPVPKSEMKSTNDGKFGIGVGGRIGMEVDLSFIDPDHSLSMLRSSSLSLDVRPMLYFLPTAEKFPMFVMTMGISYNYVFGALKKK